MAFALVNHHHRGWTPLSLFNFFFVLVVFLVSSALAQSSTPQDPDYTCSADKPCAVGCCGQFGICGMGPDFCGPGNCVNSCNAKSECDPADWGPQYAASEGCPLNVCCSKFGFCGTTTEFCGDSVIANPSCSGNSADQRTIGYYEGWSVTRACDAMTPETIPWQSYTHINFAFASIDPNTFVVVPADPVDLDLYSRLTALKTLAPGLQVWLSIGGWSMNDPDQPTATTFSDLAASPQAQAAFADSLIQLMATYGFDGVDIDWEYPVAPERSGRPEDFANYPVWLTNLRAAFVSSGRNYGLSITLPSSFWYLQNFDIVKLETVVDWFNMMEYDLHGTWDSTDVWIGAYVNAHTNLTEIDQSLKLLWRNNIDPSKVVLGLGFYGRSFALQDPSCTAPGCPFSGGAPAGPCTDSVGTLSFSEIEEIIEAGATVTLDDAAAVKIVTWDGNWVSYDDAITLKTKIDYANSVCLGGTMVWAVSLDDKSGTASDALAGGSTSGLPKTTNLLAINGPQDVCSWSACTQPADPQCPPGQSAAFSTTDGCGVTNDQIAQAGTDGLFPHRHYCCPTNQMPKCTAEQASPGSCTVPDTCPDGTTSILKTQRFTAIPYCLNVDVNWCCSAPAQISPRSLGCYWTECGQSTCLDGSLPLASATLGQDGAPTCVSGQKHTLCCPSPLAIDTSTCSWQKGSSLLGICIAGCPSDKMLIADDIDQSQSCILGFESYCCDPPKEAAAAVSEGASDFNNVVHQFLSAGTCSVNSGLLDKRQSSEIGISTVTTLYMASRLAPLLWDYVNSPSEGQYLQAYQQDWDSQRSQVDGSAPSWSSLVNTVEHVTDTTAVVGAIAQALCPTVTGTSSIDPIICSLSTCSGGASCSATQKRARALTPSDVTDQNYPTDAVRTGPGITDALTFGAGQVEWWIQAKNLDWWQGSNHGVDSILGTEIASSFYVDFAPNPSDNVFTGAGPVWGCTIVSVVTNLGAWTAHFWQGFFNDMTNFTPQVLDFLMNGNAIEDYLGLAALVADDMPFDIRSDLVQFISVKIITPQLYVIIPGATFWQRPQVVMLPGQYYPLQVALIQQQIRAIFQAEDLPIDVHTYGSDQLIWNWEPEFVPTGDGLTVNIHWSWRVDRSPRLTNAPWTGMLTIQRSPTNDVAFIPTVSIRVEGLEVLNQFFV